MDYGEFTAMFSEDIAGAVETGGIGRQMQDKDKELSKQRRLQLIEFQNRASVPGRPPTPLHGRTLPPPPSR